MATPLSLGLASGSARIPATCSRCFGPEEKGHVPHGFRARSVSAAGSTFSTSWPSNSPTATCSEVSCRYEVSSSWRGKGSWYANSAIPWLLSSPSHGARVRFSVQGSIQMS